MQPHKDNRPTQRQPNPWDAIDAWFEWVTHCPMEATSEDCFDRCIKMHLGHQEELWESSVCL